MYYHSWHLELSSTKTYLLIRTALPHLCCKCLEVGLSKPEVPIYRYSEGQTRPYITIKGRQLSFSRELEDARTYLRIQIGSGVGYISYR